MAITFSLVFENVTKLCHFAHSFHTHFRLPPAMVVHHHEQINAMCMCMHVQMYVCLCAHTYMYVYLYVCMCVHTCVHVCFHKRLCVHASVGVCVCVLYVCTHVFVCECVHVSVCTHTGTLVAYCLALVYTAFHPGRQCFQSHPSRAGCLSSSVRWTNRLLQRWQCFSLSISVMWPLTVSEF